MTRIYLVTLALTPLLLTGLLISGCASKPVPEITTYTLENSTPGMAHWAPQPGIQKVIKIAIPQSPAAIMSRQILYQDKDLTQNAYLYSRWSEIPNKMLAQLMLSSLNQKKLFKTVLPAYSKGKEDLLLESTLSEFHHHINADGSSTGKIRIKCYLIDVNRGTVLLSKDFSAAINAPSLDARGAVEALNSAAQSIASFLSQWLTSEVKALQ